MKKFLFISSLVLMIGNFNINSADAQVHVSINIDIQPAWGPSGYDYAEYYYIPEIDIYYDVINRLFWYNEAGRWLSNYYLPVAYSFYDFYSLYKVVINNVLNPWRFNHRHHSLYARYRYNYSQIPIYCMHDHRYERARNNFHGWVEPRHMPRNNGRPLSRDFSLNRPNGRISNDMRSPSSPDNRRTEITRNNPERKRSEATATRTNPGRNESTATRTNPDSRRTEASRTNPDTRRSPSVNTGTPSASRSQSGNTATARDSKTRVSGNTSSSSRNSSTTVSANRSSNRSSSRESSGGSRTSRTESSRSSGRR